MLTEEAADDRSGNGSLASMGDVESEAKLLRRLVSKPQPPNEEIGVCFFAPTPAGFGSGKVSAKKFLPTFCDRLRSNGIITSFATSNSELSSTLGQTEKSVAVCIYREVGFTASSELHGILDDADLVFNHPKSGAIIAQKPIANAVLAAAGCPVPRPAAMLDNEDVVFSNEISASGAGTYTSSKAEGLDAGRHNVEFVDTRREYDGREYYTTMRLMCINDRITHQFLRARDTAQDDPSVHAKDTPIDPELINYLWKDVLDSAADQFQAIAKSIYRAFGPGFYSHDTLVDRKTGRAVVCETGYKFNDTAYHRHLHEITHEVHGLRGYERPENAASTSSAVFLELIRRALEI